MAYFDEAVTRVAGRNHWLHAAATPRLTAYHIDAHGRGVDSITAFKILPRFAGVAVTVGMIAQTGQKTVCGMYYDTDHSSGMAAIFLAVTITISGVILVVFRAVVVPVVYSFASLVSAGIRLALGGTPLARNDDTLAVWRAERGEQFLRLCKIGVLTVLVAVSSAFACSIARESPSWVAVRREGVVDWLAIHLTNFDITWSWHLRYAVAVILAWFFTAELPSRHRGWKAWTVWLLIFTLVSGLWPERAWKDNFRLELSGRFDHLDGIVALDAFARIAGYQVDGRSAKAVDLTSILTDKTSERRLSSGSD